MKNALRGMGSFKRRRGAVQVQEDAPQHDALGRLEVAGALWPARPGGFERLKATSDQRHG
jgi:hypothetical protein